MHNTQSIKPSHYERGFFHIGSGPEVILILGSCRVVPYLNFFNYLNKDNRFTLCIIDVVNFYHDKAGTQVDPIQFTRQFEDNKELRDMLGRCRVFLHEHTENFGVFNSSKDAEKNIYQLGIKPEVDVSIPNFNNIFVMFQEYMDYDTDIRNEARVKMSPEWAARVKARGLGAIQHFLDICAKTNLPEFGTMFANTWRNVRYFWTGNHVSNRFTGAVFGMVNEKYLHLPTDQGFWDYVKADSSYSTPCAPITAWDRRAYGLTWPEIDEPLNIP